MPATDHRDTPRRPPSVDALARSLSGSGLPHPILVDLARTAIADGAVDHAAERADEYRRSLLTEVVNATGVLLHTNLGRAPFAHQQAAHAQTVEFDLATGERGSRQRAIGSLLARLCDTEAAMVVNNNAAAVLLVLAAVAAPGGVAVARGESVEIGGSFRVPDVMAQSGARLIDVGTTNRTRRADYAAAVASGDAVAVLKVHPSNYRIDGFTEETPVGELADLGVPVIVDIGSGLLDASVPWLSGPPPAWLAEEPAAKQTLAAGADLVTFSGDKLFGGPQAGIIAGRSDLVAACMEHPLARALRCGGLVTAALQSTALSYLGRTAGADLTFWRLATAPIDSLRTRAEHIIDRSGVGTVIPTDAVPGAGSVPGVTIPSIGVALAGDHVAALRAHDRPVIARTRDGVTTLDLRSVDPDDDHHLIAAIEALALTS